MLRFFINIILIIPFCVYSQEYKTDIDSLNAKAKQCIHIDLDSAYFFAEKAIKESQKYHYQEGEMVGQFQKGRILYDQARRTLAMDAGEKSLFIAEKLDNYEGQKNALNLITKIQNHSKQFEKGLITAKESYYLAKAQNDSVEMALMSNFLGIFKNRLGEKDSAYYFTMQSMKINKQLNTQKALAYNYNSLGIHHYGNKELDSTFFYLRTALKIRTELKLPNQSIEAYNNLGYVFLLEKVPDSAIFYFQKCINTCLEYGKKHNLAIAYENISEAYELNNNYKSSLDALKKAIPINDSLTGIKQKEQIISVQKGKNKELDIRHKIDNSQKKKQYILIFALLIALVIGFILSRISKKRSIETVLHKQKTTAAKSLINEQEQLREEIAQELHDGIGGSLAGLKLNISKIQKQNDCQLLIKELEHIDQTYNEIRNISHNLTPVSFQKQSLSLTIKEYISRSFPEKKTEVYFHCHPETEISNLFYDQKICVYRIVQELVTNIQKHANATNVNISLIGHGNHLTIMSEDNGVGFDNNNNNNNGIGFKNIRKRLTLYDGNIEIDSSKNNGTTIVINLPYKSPM